MKQVEVLYFDGCPTWQRAVELVRQVLTEVGESSAELRVVRVESEDDARRLRFVGSPTIRVNSCDIDPSVERASEFGLQCRLYRDGDRFSGLPPMALLRASLGVEPSARAERVST